MKTGAGTTGAKRTPEREAIIRDALANGASLTRAARLAGVARQTAVAWLPSMGVEAPARAAAKLVGGLPPMPMPLAGMATPPPEELAALRLLASRGRMAAQDLAPALGERFAWEAMQRLAASPYFERDHGMWSLSAMGWAAVRDAGGRGEPGGMVFSPSASNGRFRPARRPAHRSEAS